MYPPPPSPGQQLDFPQIEQLMKNGAKFRGIFRLFPRPNARSLILPAMQIPFGEMKSADLGEFVKLRRQLSEEKTMIEHRLRLINEALGEMPLPSLSPLQGVIAPSNQEQRRRGRGTRSPEARARMAAAQRKRWAAAGSKAPASIEDADPAVESKEKPRRKMSEAGRKAIAEAAKRRWAAARAAGKTAL